VGVMWKNPGGGRLRGVLAKHFAAIPTALRKLGLLKRPRTGIVRCDLPLRLRTWNVLDICV